MLLTKTALYMQVWQPPTSKEDGTHGRFFWLTLSRYKTFRLFDAQLYSVLSIWNFVNKKKGREQGSGSSQKRQIYQGVPILNRCTVLLSFKSLEMRIYRKGQRKIPAFFFVQNTFERECRDDIVEWSNFLVLRFLDLVL